MIPAEHDEPFARDGAIRVGGTDLGRLCAQVGSTPFFAYDRARISARVSTVSMVASALTALE